MNRFLRFYLFFCILNLTEIILYIVYAKILISDSRKMGIRIHATIVYGISGFFFGNFISFTAFSYATLVLNHIALIFYLYYTYFIFLNNCLLLPFVKRPYLILAFLIPYLIEIFYVLKNFDLFARKILFQRNKNGSNLRVKKALNVSKF